MPQLAAGTGAPSTITLELVTATVGSAVPILFAADPSGDIDCCGERSPMRSSPSASAIPDR